MSSSPLSFDPYVIDKLPVPSFPDTGCGYGKRGFLLRSCRATECGLGYWWHDGIKRPIAIE